MTVFNGVGCNTNFKNYLELLRIADIIRIYDVNILRIENCFGIYGLLSFPHCVV